MNTIPGMCETWTDFWGMMLVAVPIGCIGWLVIGMIIFLIWVLIAAV